MKKFLFIAITIVTSTLWISCNDDEGYEDYDNFEAVTKDFNGDWFIIGYFPDGSIAYGGGYVLYTTSNTAANDENFWIDDHGAFFEIKTTVQADLDDLVFSGPENAPELITGGTVTVSNGKIIKNGGRGSATGTVVDSIYFEAEFDWDPGTVYQFAGHKRSGFLEDEH
ncbi:lipid-binding protein [Zhouia amylolytica]|uniref:Uncharacterized protein n=1 Tax=Zhouia amylolytica AD3 TaxID=1286632 RepID=W2UT95_9FLAO|nr:lipid-binding protein [Zhouia amylolytica]ETN96726.1 hypothetical protein P278_01520 [Zhouia amylolytica AD3]